MKQIIINVALAFSLSFPSEGFCAPPDVIPNSPVPPLRAPAPRTAFRVPLPAAGQAAAPIPTPIGGQVAPAASAASNPATPTSASAVPADPAPYPTTEAETSVPESPEAYDEQRAALWNSPAMNEARQWVMEYSRLSAQTSPREGQEFLARLSKLSPAEMDNWLQRYQATRERLARQQAVGAAARQQMVEQAIGRLQTTWQAYANINRGKNEAAEAARGRLQAQQDIAGLQSTMREASRNEAIAGQRVIFDPFAPTLDPASPNRRTRAAAAATLPGDLPRGDPRNNAVDVVDGDAPGGGTVVLEGGGTVPNNGGQSGAAGGDAAAGGGAGTGGSSE